MNNFELPQSEQQNTQDASNSAELLALNLESNQESQSWIRRNMMKLSLATFVGGTAVMLATNPLGEVKDNVVDAAPWVAGGLIASEAMWIGGAALMASAVGKKVGNPFKLKEEYDEISTSSVLSSKAFKIGLGVNTVGALGTAGVIGVGAVTSLPYETWPGAVGLAGADIAATLALRGGVYASIKNNESELDASKEKMKSKKVTVRKATEEDIDELADIDLLLFDKAYGTQKPEKQEIVDMLHKRLENNPGWMFVAEMDGKLEGFMTAFQTNVPIEEFESWEKSTADGTLEGKVDPNGKYIYIANMTVKHEAVAEGAEMMMMANLFANSIESDADYGYFISRMPHFKRWMEAQGKDPYESKDDLAEEYLELRREDGKRQDPQLRMYESFGFGLKRMVADAFEDDASLDYGVIFRVENLVGKKLRQIKPVRLLASHAVRQVAKHPKILKKLL